MVLWPPNYAPLMIWQCFHDVHVLCGFLLQMSLLLLGLMATGQAVSFAESLIRGGMMNDLSRTFVHGEL